MHRYISAGALEKYPELSDFIDRRMKDCPFVGYPTGWFIVAYSDEVKPGEVKSYRYFGQDMIVWRNAAGEARVMDAHCPHMGGHLGHGGVGVPHEHGKVVDDSVQCPWHGWRWNAAGENVEIPNADQCNKFAKVKVWHAKEVYNRWIMVWHDRLGRDPLWESPVVPELEMPEEYYLDPEDVAVATFSDLFFPLPMLSENYVDGAHVKYVHGSEIGDITVLEDSGPVYKSLFDVEFRSRKSYHGNVGTIRAEGWGQGITVNKLYGVHENIMFIGHTPTDGWRCDIRVFNFARRVPGEDHPSGLAKLTIEKQLTAICEDQPIVEFAHYNRRPAFTETEAPQFLSVRRWTRQFYPLHDELAGARK